MPNPYENIEINDAKAKNPPIPNYINPKIIVSTCEFKAVHLGFAFALLFVAFNVTQTNLTTLFPSIGLYTFCTIYFCFAIGGILGPEVASLISKKWAMVVGSISLGLFVGCINFRQLWLVFICAGLSGLGSGILWTNQGAWLAELSNRSDNPGTIVGLFFGVMATNGIIGNLISLAILSSGAPITMMIWAMTIICFLGTGLLSLIDPLDHAPAIALRSSTQLKDSESQLSPQKPIESTMTRLRNMWNCAIKRQTLLLSLYMFAQGATSSLAFTLMPQCIPDSIEEKSLLLAQIFICYGVASVIVSLITGKIYDRFGWKPLIVLNLASLFTGLLVLIYGIELNKDKDNLGNDVLVALFLVTGFMFGTSDTTSNSLLNITLSEYGDMAPSAFGVYRVWFCLGTVLGSLMLAVFGKVGNAAVTTLVLCGGCAMYVGYRKEKRGVAKEVALTVETRSIVTKSAMIVHDN